MLCKGLTPLGQMYNVRVVSLTNCLSLFFFKLKIVIFWSFRAIVKNKIFRQDIRDQNNLCYRKSLKMQHLKRNANSDVAVEGCLSECKTKKSLYNEAIVMVVEKKHQF